MKFKCASHMHHTCIPHVYTSIVLTIFQYSTNPTSIKIQFWIGNVRSIQENWGQYCAMHTSIWNNRWGWDPRVVCCQSIANLMSIQCHSCANLQSIKCHTNGVAKPYPGGVNSVPTQCNLRSILFQSKPNRPHISDGPSRTTLAPIHWQSYSNLLPIQCQLSANPSPIWSQSCFNPLPIICESRAIHVQMICQSFVNPVQIHR